MNLIELSDYLWEIPKTGAMRVPGRVYASAKMIEATREALDRHAFRGEIKAVTYHQLMLENSPGGWRSRVIFDF